MNNKEDYTAAKTKALKELADNYQALFNTPLGQKVLADLTNKFIMNNSVSLSAQNINYEAAYKNGEAGVVHHIIKQLNTRL